MSTVTVWNAEAQKGRASGSSFAGSHPFTPCVLHSSLLTDAVQSTSPMRTVSDSLKTVPSWSQAGFMLLQCPHLRGATSIRYPQFRQRRWHSGRRVSRSTRGTGIGGICIGCVYQGARNLTNAAFPPCNASSSKLLASSWTTSDAPIPGIGMLMPSSLATAIVTTQTQ